MVVNLRSVVTLAKTVFWLLKKYVCCLMFSLEFADILKSDGEIVQFSRLFYN